MTIYLVVKHTPNEKIHQSQVKGFSLKEEEARIEAQRLTKAALWGERFIVWETQNIDTSMSHNGTKPEDQILTKTSCL